MNNILNEYLELQQNILSEEKIWIEELKLSFHAKIKEVDDRARKLHNDESYELKLAIAKQSKMNSNLNEQLAVLYTSILGNRIEQHEIRKRTLQDELTNLSSLQENEIKRQQGDLNKLSKYRIANATIPNIGYSTVSNLAHVGITTAADFTYCGLDGSLKNSVGKWVKASGVGWSRAYDLVSWRNQIEANENQKITKKVMEDFENRFTMLRDSISKLELTFNHELKPFQNQYSKEKATIDLMKYEQNASAKSQFTAIISKYDQQEGHLKEQVSGIFHDFQRKLNDIASATVNGLDNNLHKHETLAKIKTQEIIEFIKSLESDIAKIILLQEQLNQLRGKSR